MIKLARFWDSIRSSYWFVPAVMTVSAVALSAGTLAIDSALGPIGSRRTAWLFAGGPESARALLTMLAASMLTIFGVVFSIVIVALTLASSQFGPRLIRTFLSDTIDQMTVGTFISTFVYCLLVARTVGGDRAEPFVPHLSVSVAILLALASLGILIYFINHLSISLQASYIIATVGADLKRTIEAELSERDSGTPDPSPVEIQEAFASATVCILASSGGYIQAIDYGQLVDLAQSEDLVLRLGVCAGDFLVRGDEVALIPSVADRISEVAEVINSALVVGTDRTHVQDIEFPIDQLVQLAVRALSPAINDPITAIMAIEQLRAGLCYIAERASPTSVIRDNDGAPRLFVKRRDAAHNVEAAFSLIRQYGRPNLEVSIALLEAIEQIGRRTTDMEFRGALLQQATLVGHGAQSALPEEVDRMRVVKCLQRVVDALQSVSQPGETCQ
jgi:uncharacterized membrane protein